MAGEDRTAPDAVAQGTELEREPHRFGFYQALRRLECQHRSRPRLGRSLKPADDPVRLAQQPSLAFAPSTVTAFEPGTDGRPPRLSVLFFGLFGPNGPLPLHLTHYARDRMRNSDDPTFARFADVFHHRMLSLFYRAWADAQPAVQFDRPETDRFSVYVGSLFGMAQTTLRNRDALQDATKLHYAGSLSCQTRHAAGLEAMLADYFKIPVKIEEFVGQWVGLPSHSVLRLGETPETGTLGRTATVGGRVWACQQKFRIVFGPADLADYRRMLPGSDSLRRLVALVRNYVGDQFTWDVNLILEKEEVPPLALGQRGRLGWTTWLAGRPFEADAADLVLNPVASLG